MAQFTGSLVVKGNVSASNGITGSLLGTATKSDTIWVNSYATYNGNQRVAFVGGVTQHHALRADTEFNFNPGQNKLIVPNADFSGTVKAQLISESAQVVLTDTTGNISGSRVVGDIQASSVEFTNVLNKPIIVSSSTQIEELGFVTMSVTIISSSTQIVQNLPGNTVSSSTQIINLIENNYGGTVVTSSNQIFNLGFVSQSTTLYSSSTQIVALLPTNVPSASNAELHLNAMGGYQETGSIRFGREDGVGRYHEIEGYNTNNAANSYIAFKVHDGTVDSTQEVLRLKGDGTAKGPFISQSAQVDLASATGNAANADNATTASYVSGSNVDGEVYEAERARRIEVGSYGSYSNLTDIPFITGDYGNSIKRISSDGKLRWHAGTDHLTVPGVDATTLTGSLDFSHLVGLPTLISESAQVLNSGVVSGSAQVVSLLDNQDVDLGTGDITASAFSGDGSGLTNISSDAVTLPAGLISSSNQVNANSILNFDSNVESALSNNSVDFGTGTVEAATIETGRINSDIDAAENITFENQRIKFRVGEGYNTGQEVFTIERDTDGAYDVTVFKGYNSSANFQVRGSSINNLLLVKSTFDRVAIGGDTYDELFCVNGNQKINDGILRIYEAGGGFQKRNLIISDNGITRVRDNFTSSFHTNTIIGDQAGRTIDVGSHNNVIIGDWIGYEYTNMGDWADNVVVGNSVARYALDMERCSVLGASSLPHGGYNSVAIGYGALTGAKQGSYNIGIGTVTGFAASSSASDGNIYIGYKAGPSTSEGSHLKVADAQLYIGYDWGEENTLLRGDMRRKNFRVNVADDYQYLNRIGNPGFYVSGSSYFTGSVDVYQSFVAHDDAEITGSLNVSNSITASGFQGDGSGLTGIDVRSFGGDGSITGSLKVDSFVTASEFKGNASSATKIDGFTDLNDTKGPFPLLMTANSQSGAQGDGNIGFGGVTTSGGGLYFDPNRSSNNTDCQLTIGNSGNIGILDVDRIDMGADILISDGVIRLIAAQNGGSVQFYDADDPSAQNTGHLWRSGTELYFGKSTSDKSKVVTDSDDILKIAPSDPLPTGAVGNLAVSASNLYFHNGSSWSQIN